MLTNKQNLLETIRGGHPDRVVNQFEFMEILFVDPYNATNPLPAFPGDENKVDFWGVTWCWPEDNPGYFPIHDEKHTVIKDIKNWKQYVKAPPLEYDQKLWDAAKAEYDKFNRNDVFVGPLMFPGIFEEIHSLMGMEEALMAFYMYPKEIKELIEFIVEWESAYVELLAKHVSPNVVFHHDDWGSEVSTLLSPVMFQNFFLEPYKRLYKCYKDNGFELIVHHSDSYAATLVPFMIEMGIDIWQGATKSNDLPKLIKEYGGRISFMAGIDSTAVDKPNWKQEDITAEVEWLFKNCGTKYIIPCQTQGGPFSNIQGVYEMISKEIDRFARIYFK